MNDAPSIDYGIPPNDNNSNQDVPPSANLQPEGTGVDNVAASVQPPILDSTSTRNPNKKEVAPLILSGSDRGSSGVETVSVPVQPPIVDETFPIPQ